MAATRRSCVELALRLFIISGALFEFSRVASVGWAGVSLAAAAYAQPTPEPGANFSNRVNVPQLPPPSGDIVNVSTVAQLQNAVSNLRSGQTIVIAPGDYAITRSLVIGSRNAASPLSAVGIRGQTNDPSDVVIHGRGMDDRAVTMGISVWYASNVTIANLTVKDVWYHCIEIKGDLTPPATSVHVYNTVLLEAGEQIIKGQSSAGGVGSADSSVEYSTIGFSVAPSTIDHGSGTGYTQGVDVHSAARWLIKNNVFKNFHTPDSSRYLWNPAVLFWNHSRDNQVIGNFFYNCDRAIGMGLMQRTYDNQRGVIANNMIFMSPGLYSWSRKIGADAPIIVWDSPGTIVYGNTVITNGNTPNSIQVRWGTTTNVLIQNNLADAPIRSRDGASYSENHNYLSAAAGMFVGPTIGDLHLLGNLEARANVLGRGSPLAAVATDYDGDPRGRNPDIGADQLSSRAGRP